jgi:hypothetical protein
MIHRAMAPTIKPTMMVQMIPIIPMISPRRLSGPAMLAQALGAKV